jgi:hypothetical protein
VRILYSRWSVSPIERETLAAFQPQHRPHPTGVRRERLAHICALCAVRGTDVFRLGTKLGIDSMELVQTINGKVVPTRAVISGLAKELESSVSLLTKLAAEIKS